MDCCLKCKLQEPIVERSDYCAECYAGLRSMVHAAADRTWGMDDQRGRPRIGLARTIKVTLPLECWHWLDDCIEHEHAKTMPELIRSIIMSAQGLTRK